MSITSSETPTLPVVNPELENALRAVIDHFIGDIPVGGTTDNGTLKVATASSLLAGAAFVCAHLPASEDAESIAACACAHTHIRDDDLAKAFQAGWAAAIDYVQQTLGDAATYTETLVDLEDADDDTVAIPEPSRSDIAGRPPYLRLVSSADGSTGSDSPSEKGHDCL